MISFSSLYLTTFLTLFSLQATADPSLPTDEVWWKDVCRGEKLDAAMRWSEPQASSFLSPINSPWDGPLYSELKTWGYTETNPSDNCDFDFTWNMRLVFASLRIDPRSTNRGGSNQCFRIQHGSFEGWTPIDSQRYTVNGKEYQIGELLSPKIRSKTYKMEQATSAISVIGVNPYDGMVYFINVKSPAKAAERLWGHKPNSADLPALRAQSDFAWGFWLRTHISGGIERINGIWSINVVNHETLQILTMAFKTYHPEPGTQKVDGPQIWPGTNFNTLTVKGLAILGTPNGLAPGYFLAQHKRQFGSNKMIYKVTVFKNYVDSVWPNLIFWVKDAKPIFSESGTARRVNNATALTVGYGEPKVLRKSLDGKHVLREHVLNVKY